METYANLGGDSNVKGFEIGVDFIRVQFKDSSIYKYTNQSAGEIHVNEMKRLAKAGQGLNSYIMLNCKKGYESKE
ncbi:MAG: hypothetical protein MUD00_00145 [Candidatus Pacebacteria bacterium]|jgi:hypothetical protein|nr:hypothetical protein [Candidatus Paceibacterota bacterium]